MKKSNSKFVFKKGDGPEKTLDYIAVILEKQQGNFDLLMEAHQETQQRLDRFEKEVKDNFWGLESNLNSFKREVYQRFDQIDERLDKIESRLDKVEVRLDKVETRLDKVENCLDDHDEKFVLILDHLMRIEDEISVVLKLESRVERIENVLNLGQRVLA